jgi:hypothetical protein
MYQIVDVAIIIAAIATVIGLSGCWQSGYWEAAVMTTTVFVFMFIAS